MRKFFQLRFQRVFTLVVCMGVTAVIVCAQDIKVTCTPTPPCTASSTQLCIDASTGHVDRKGTNLRVGNELNVVVYNKNPFAYHYVLSTAEKTIADDDISTFVKVWMPSLSKSDVQPPKDTLTTNMSNNKFWAEAEPLKHVKIENKTLPDEVQQFGQAANDLATDIGNQFNDYAKLREMFQNGIDGLKALRCVDIQDSANTARKSWAAQQKSLLDRHQGKISDEMYTLNSTYSQLTNKINDEIATNTNELNTQLAQVPEKGHEADYQKKSAKAFESLQNAQHLKASLDQTKQTAINLECMYASFVAKQWANASVALAGFDTALKDPDNFWREQAIGASSNNPGEVTVTLKRSAVKAQSLPASPKFQPSSATACSKDLLTQNDFAGLLQSGSSDTGSDSPTDQPTAQGKSTSTKPSAKSGQTDTSGYETVRTVVVDFGGARFVTAAGITFGLLSNPQYDRVSGIPLDTSGRPTSQTFTSIVGLKSNSGIRIVPSVYLHAQLPPFPTNSHWNDGWYLTFGIGPHFDNKGAAAEYLFGISHSLSGQRVFLTAGAYIGQQQELRNGLYLGQNISALQGTLPVEQRTTARFGVAISYRFGLGGGSSNQSKTKGTTGGTPSDTGK